MLKFTLLTLLFLFFTGSTSDISSSQVAHLTLKVAGLSSETKYYGFAAGDEIDLSLQVRGGKELKEIEIFRYPDHSLFQDYEANTSKHVFTVSETGVYGIKLYNANVLKRVCKLNITRKPAHDSLKQFNTQVHWRTVVDTNYYTVQEKYLASENYVTKSIQAPQYFYINSGSHSLFKGGKSRIRVPVEIPPGTVEWYYTFSADRNEEQIKKTTAGLDLLGDLSLALDQTGSVGFAMTLLTSPPGGHVCDIYLTTPANSILFERKEAFYYISSGTRKNIKSGVVKITNPNIGTYYLGLKNPDNMHGVHISLEVAAVVYEQVWDVRDVTKFETKSWQAPYLK